MHVGVCRITMRFPENESLKGKRQVLSSVSERLRRRYNVAVAEVDANDKWQMAVIGVSCVSNSSRHANEVLSNVVKFIEESRLDVELLDYEIELLTAL